MKKTVWFFLCLLLCLTAAVSSAKADSQTWYFTGTNNQPGVPCSAGGPCGEVTLTTSGSNATFTVSSLLSGYIFDNFAFNYTNPNLLSLTACSGEVSGCGLLTNTGGIAEDGWGKFTNVFDTGKNGGSSGGDCVVTGGVPGAGCTFTFTLHCSTNCALSLADFQITSSGGTGSGIFAGHLAASADRTGYVGAPETTIPVDEPTTLSVVGSGLLMAGGLLRRRIFGFLG